MSEKHGPWVSREVAGYVVRVRLRDAAHQVYGCDFELLEIRSWPEEPSDEGPEVDETPVLHGWVKWDGCSHLMSQQDCYVHVCGGDGWEDLCTALAAVYPLCAEVMPENLTHMEPMPVVRTGKAVG